MEEELSATEEFVLPLDVEAHPVNLPGGERRYYGRVRRKTATVKNVIHDLARRYDTGLSPSLLFQAESEIQKASLAELRLGNAVSLLGLGVLYIAVEGAVKPGETPAAATRHLTLRFTPSATALSALRNLSVGSVTRAGASSYIDYLADPQRPDDRDAITPGHIAVVHGRHLKLGGAVSGLFLAPALREKSRAHWRPSPDEGAWLALPPPVRNTPATLEFYVPATLRRGAAYFVVVRTSLNAAQRERRRPVDIVSPRPVLVRK